MRSPRVCVIGAGPCGMSVLRQFAKMMADDSLETGNLPEVTCYEKQASWGGQWNFCPIPGYDSNGEISHSSMYRDLWTNGPKESLEYPDYTFVTHFGRNIPSYQTRSVIRDYLEGRFKQFNVLPWIKFNTVVLDVVFNDSLFKVQTVDLTSQQRSDYKEFDFVVNATGHYTFPYTPEISGMEKFEGQVMHVHDFKQPSLLSGKRVLVVGSSYSAEDILMLCVKYKSATAVYSYRSTTLDDFNWPTLIKKKPMIVKVEAHSVHFVDKTEEDFDLILLCTGYRHHYPYLSNDLRLKSGNTLFPKNLYKGLVFTEGGDGRMIYMGTQDLIYSFAMFTVQALWTVQYITGKHKLPNAKSMATDIDAWSKKLETLTTFEEKLKFQTDYILSLQGETEYPYNLDAIDKYLEWFDNKKSCIMTYRDASHTSKFTHLQAPVRSEAFQNTFDDSLEHYLQSF